MKLGQRTNGAASLTLSHSTALPSRLREVVEVSQVSTDPESRRQYLATGLLREVCNEADREHVVLMLLPEGEDWLQCWYERFGFIRIQENPVLMARKPMGKENGRVT